MTIGRSPEATVPLVEDKFLSSIHFSIQSWADRCLLYDLNSRNGVQLNGSRVGMSLLRTGDRVSAGSSEIKIEFLPDWVYPLPPAPFLDHMRPAGPRLFAIVDTAVDKQALYLLYSPQAKVEILYQGDAATQLADQAPYLVQFWDQSLALEDLLRYGWGKSLTIFFFSDGSFEDVRDHLRKFLTAKLSDGREVWFRFYDPRVLRDYLPTCAPSEVANFFGAAEKWMMEDKDPTVLLEFSHVGGQIETKKVVAKEDQPAIAAATTEPA